MFLLQAKKILFNNVTLSIARLIEDDIWMAGNSHLPASLDSECNSSLFPWLYHITEGQQYVSKLLNRYGNDWAVGRCKFVTQNTVLIGEIVF